MVLWIFGYGSLIWTPDFHYEERLSGYVKDFRRVFVPAESGDDGSTSPTGKGGLGLSLRPDEGAITQGIAYRVTADVEEQIVASYLKESESQSSFRRSKACMLDFFTKENLDAPALSRVLTFVDPPQRSSLWYIVLQQLAPLVTVDQNERRSVRSDRAKRNTSSKKKERFASRRLSEQEHWRLRAWFDSQQSLVTNMD